MRLFCFFIWFCVKLGWIVCFLPQQTRNKQTNKWEKEKLRTNGKTTPKLEHFLFSSLGKFCWEAYIVVLNGTGVARLLSLPWRPWLWFIFPYFKLVQIYETLNTIVEVIGGLKGLSGSGGTWKHAGCFRDLSGFPCWNSLLKNSLLGVWIYLFLTEEWIFRTSQKWKKYTSLDPVCFVWLSGCLWPAPLFFFHTQLAVFWRFPFSWSYPHSYLNFNYPFCSCIQTLNLWPINLRGSEGSLVLPSCSGLLLTQRAAGVGQLQ